MSKRLLRDRKALAWLPIDVHSMRPSGYFAETLRNAERRHQLVSKWQPRKGCPVCGQYGGKVAVTKFGLDMLACETCGVWYSSQLPASVSELYDAEFYAASLCKNYSNIDYRKRRFGAERLGLIESICGKLHGASLLDVGCGTGWFLALAREAGLHTMGHDLSERLAHATEERLGIRVTSCSLDQIKERFNVITLFDVLEHVDRPIVLLEQLKRLLLPGGGVLVFTPNHASVAIWIMRNQSQLVCPAEHVNLFCRRTVREIAKRVRMEVAFLSVRGIDIADLAAYWEYRGKRLRASCCRRLCNWVQPFVDYLNLGNHIRFVLR